MRTGAPNSPDRGSRVGRLRSPANTLVSAMCQNEAVTRDIKQCPDDCGNYCGAVGPSGGIEVSAPGDPVRPGPGFWGAFAFSFWALMGAACSAGLFLLSTGPIQGLYWLRYLAQFGPAGVASGVDRARLARSRRVPACPPGARVMAASDRRLSGRRLPLVQGSAATVAAESVDLRRNRRHGAGGAGPGLVPAPSGSGLEPV
jgi:hypothetical protein